MEEQTVEVSGRTREEALAEALKRLDATEEQVAVESVEESESKGFLGFGAQTTVTLRVRKLPLSLDLARECLRKALASMELEAEVILREQDDDYLYLDLEGGDLARAIGRHGQTLEALQLIANLVATKGSFDRKRVVLDAAGYRQRRHEKLAEEAKRIAEKALRSGQQQSLRPMNSAERRVIHMTVSAIEGVSTHSEGEGDRRHVIVVPDQQHGSSRRKRGRRGGSSSGDKAPKQGKKKGDEAKPSGGEGRSGKGESYGPGRITSFGEDDIEWG